MQIQLPIKNPLHRQYLNYLFYRHSDGSYVISKRIDFGKAIISYVKYSLDPHKKSKSSPLKEDLVTFILPQVDSLHNAQHYHLYFTQDDQKKLTDLLSIYFNLDFDRYYLAGKKSGEQQKHIIQSFIHSRKLSLLSPIGTLKKRQYRNEMRSLELTTKKLVNKAYQRNERIEYFKAEQYAC